MTDLLSTLPPEVREAVAMFDANLRPMSVFSVAHQTIRADLLRVYAENANVHRAAKELQQTLFVLNKRAEKAEAELAQLRAKIESAPAGNVLVSGDKTFNVILDCPPLPESCLGKRVRLIADDEIRAPLDAKEGE